MTDLAPRVRRALLGRPWWAQALLVYLLTRVFTTGVLLIAWSQQGFGPPHSWRVLAQPPFDLYLSRWWDGWWYHQVATTGYPHTLPLDFRGRVDKNTWAFFPLYPMLVRGLMTLTGGSWDLLAPLLSLVLGCAAAVVVHRLVTEGAPRAVAARPGLPVLTVAAIGLYPAATVLQAGYTESLALLLVAGSLLLVLRRAYLWAALPVAALGFTRAVALPMAVVVLVHAWLRWREQRAGRDRLGVRELVRIGVLLAVAGVSGLAWPAICGWVTGIPDAYLLTQKAWRVGRGAYPFAGWARLGIMPWPVAVGIVLIVLGMFAMLASRSARRLGAELYVWSAAYLVYILSVGDIIFSLVRFFLLAFPFGVVALGLETGDRPRARRWPVVLLGVSAVLQVAWIWTVWKYTPHEFSIGAP
ncbi:hypothetical protein CELL_01138 [Cellulomonas sp. T2.31MG-18]|uniref:hypothetical protein n=1 Tax=Cellulomonas sp. T2.31MG-18 TaxID=3157619 RepID=UPI0035EB93DD